MVLSGWKSDAWVPHIMGISTTDRVYRFWRHNFRSFGSYNRSCCRPNTTKPQCTVPPTPRKRLNKGSQNLPLPGNTGGIYSGDLTYYAPGLGACGITSTSQDMICAISHQLFGPPTLLCCADW